MFRGNIPAKIDDKGRLKVPMQFREELDGGRCFITSFEGDCVRVYPFKEWLRIEKKLAAAPSMNLSVQKIVDRVNYYGQEAQIDNQGRILIHPLLRDSASMNGDVAVLGKHTYLEVWNDKLFVERKLKGSPLTKDDFDALASLGI
jgi:MraZ protein